MFDNRPIGLFDTGVGGLLIFKALRIRFPNEQFICLADANYLNREDRADPKVACRWSGETGRKLIKEHECKALIVACNSAYIAGENTFKHFDVPVAGPIEHAVKAALGVTKNGIVGVVATDYTVQQGAYARMLQSFNPSVNCIQEGCPEWVQWVERGHNELQKWTDQYKAEVMEKRLKPLRDAGCDTLILGCTHFPALKKEIQSAYGMPVPLVDSANGIGDWLEELFTNRALYPAPSGQRGEVQYIVTADRERLQHLMDYYAAEEQVISELQTGWPSQNF